MGKEYLDGESEINNNKEKEKKKKTADTIGMILICRSVSPQIQNPVCEHVIIHVLDILKHTLVSAPLVFQKGETKEKVKKRVCASLGHTAN